MIRGYDQAHARYVAASEGNGMETPYYALFEALNWAVAIEDVIREVWWPEGQQLDWGWRERVPGAEIMPAVRLVRNLVHHHWARAPKIEFVRGRRGWTWPDADLLPPPTTPSDRKALPVYTDRMAGEKVADTLHSIAAMYALVGQFLGNR
jgi:hypothetical protein